MQIVLIYMFFHGNVLYETLLAGWLAGWLITLRAGKLQSSLSRWLDCVIVLFLTVLAG